MALSAWADLVTRMGGSSNLFLQMSEDHGSAMTTFKSAFYGKPASTLSKRAAALCLYRRWADSHGVSAWPPRESTVFTYMRFLVDERAPPTRAQSFREALGFAKGYVGLQGVDEVLASRRIAGSVAESLDAKPVLKQRDPLSAEMVRELEAYVVSDCEPSSCVLAGFMLFCVHARARVGDAIRADLEPTLDVPDPSVPFGFVEAGFLRHKTSYKVGQAEAPSRCGRLRPHGGPMGRALA